MVNIRRRLMRLYPRYFLKKDDIVLVGFPKSGTTWFRLIYLNLVSLYEFSGDVVDHRYLNEYFDGRLMANKYPQKMYSSLPILRNTHVEWDNQIFKKNKVIYIYRNPWDVMVSYYLFKKSLIKNKYENDFNNFIKDKKYGIDPWCKHVKSYINNSDYCITYEALKLNTFKEVKKFLSEIEVDNINDKTIKLAICHSDFNNIKNYENKRGLDDNAQKKHVNNYMFARRGIVGGQREYFTDTDIAFINKTLEQYDLLDLYNINEYKK